jgi:hypothetical protein
MAPSAAPNASPGLDQAKQAQQEAQVVLDAYRKAKTEHVAPIAVTFST